MPKQAKTPKQAKDSKSESEEEEPTKAELVDQLYKLLKKEMLIKNKIKLIEGSVISSKHEAINELLNQLGKNKREIDSTSSKISLA